MKKFLLLLFLSAFSLFVKAQILRIVTSPGAIPAQVPGYSEVGTINTKTISYTPSTPPADPTPVDDDSTTEGNGVYRYADVLPVSITMPDGNITSTSVGKVWTLRVSVPNALNIGFVFHQFDLSASAEMYVFNEARTLMDTAIKESHFIATTPPAIIPFNGNSIIIYIVESGNFSTLQSVIAIQKLEAGFQEVDEIGDTEEDWSRPASINCIPHVLCQPSKLPSARAVARVFSNGYAFTGTLLNNETNNGRAFFLTAFHCIDEGSGTLDPDEIAALLTARFQFRFWRTSCGGTINNPAAINFYGAVLLGQSRASDGVLLELTSPPGVGDGVNYAGWSRQDYGPSDNNSYSIHHPKAEDMRINITTNVKHWTWNNSFWTAKYSSGVMAKGSSGGALFNEFDRVIGQLKGGWSSCDFTDYGDRFGKFYVSWIFGGFGPWLSPSGNQYTDALILSTININGPSSVSCNPNGYTYTVPNLLGCSYNWSVSSNLTIQSGQGTSSIVVVKNTTDPYANGVITVTITDSKGLRRVVIANKNVDIGGAPGPGARTITTGGMTMGLQDCHTLSTQISSGQYAGWISVSNPLATSYSWTLIGKAQGAAVHLLQNPNSQNVQIDIKPHGKWATYSLSMSNGCGSYQTYHTFFANVACPVARIASVAWGVTIAPNPAQNTITIALGKLSKTEMPDEVTNEMPVTNSSANMNYEEPASTKPMTTEKSFIQQVRFFDITGVLRKTSRYSGAVQQVTISINDLSAGIYFVEVQNTTGTERKKILVQR